MVKVSLWASMFLPKWIQKAGFSCDWLGGKFIVRSERPGLGCCGVQLRCVLRLTPCGVMCECLTDVVLVFGVLNGNAGGSAPVMLVRSRI